MKFVDIKTHLLARLSHDIIDHIVAPYSELDIEFEKAAFNNNIYETSYLISVGADVHANCENALMYASRKGHLDMVKHLVSCGANVHAKVESIFVPKQEGAIFFAVSWGRLDVVKYLVSIGANIHDCNDYILFEAVMQNRYEIVEYLVSIGANKAG